MAGSSDLYKATRKIGKLASQMRDLEVMSEAMRTGDYSKVVERQLKKKLHGTAHREINKLGRK